MAVQTFARIYGSHFLLRIVCHVDVKRDANLAMICITTMMPRFCPDHLAQLMWSKFGQDGPEMTCARKNFASFIFDLIG